MESRRAAVAALDRLVGLGLPHGGTPTERTFDPVEVLNFIKWAGLERQDAFWLTRFVETGRRLVETFRTESELGEPVPFAVTLRRTFNIATRDPSKPLRLRLPMPIEDAQLRDLLVENVETAGLDCRISADRSCIEARGPAPALKVMALWARFSFTARTGTPLAGGDRTQYLRPAEGLIQVTPTVQTLADRLAEGATTDRAVVSRFWDFFLDHLICGAVHYDEVDAAPAATDWVLETGWFDCTVGVALLVALCRAKGIPARSVSGYLLYPAAPTYHFWAEIWLDGAGWSPYDLLAWDLSAGGRDPAWRNCFAGRLEPRMKTQSLPERFTGAPGVPFPSAWHLLTRQTAAGAETSFHALDDGALIHRDEIEVTMSAWRPTEPD